MERRSFIKTSCKLCMAVGSGLIVNSLSSCAPAIVFKTEISDNKILVPLDRFALSGLQIIRIKNYNYDIAVRKKSDGSFNALLMRCTHADNQLMNNGNGFTCSLHGSVFDKNGLVKKGPAENQLMEFKTERSSDSVIIHII